MKKYILFLFVIGVGFLIFNALSVTKKKTPTADIISAPQYRCTYLLDSSKQLIGYVSREVHSSLDNATECFIVVNLKTTNEEKKNKIICKSIINDIFSVIKNRKITVTIMDDEVVLDNIRAIDGLNDDTNYSKHVVALY